MSETNNLFDELVAMSPHQLAERKLKYAAELFFIYGQLEELETRESRFLFQNRDKFKSDNATKKAWNITEDGINQNGLAFREKKYKALISAINSKLKIAEGEARNIY